MAPLEMVGDRRAEMTRGHWGSSIPRSPRLGLGVDRRPAVRPDGNVEPDRVATDLAVLNIILWKDRCINENRDEFSAIGTTDFFFFPKHANGSFER